TALTSTLDGGDDGMPRSDELAPPRSGEVSKQVGGAQVQVVAAGDAHLAGEPPPHADLVAGARGVQESGDNTFGSAADAAESAQESERSAESLVGQKEL